MRTAGRTAIVLQRWGGGGIFGQTLHGKKMPPEDQGSMTHWLCVCAFMFSSINSHAMVDICESPCHFLFRFSFFLSRKDAIHRCRAADDGVCTAADANEKIRLEYARLLLLPPLPLPLQPIAGQEISGKAIKVGGHGALGRRRRQIGEEVHYTGKEGEAVSPGKNDASGIEIAAAEEEGIEAGDRERVLEGDQGEQLEGGEDKARWEEEGVGRGRGGGGDGGDEEEAEAEETWPVLVLSGWSTDDMEALLEVTVLLSLV